MRAVIAGIPGAGKTTVLNAALDELDMDVVNYGSVMFSRARQRGVTDRDQMRRLPHDVQRVIQLEAAEEIAARDNVIIDTHCTVKTPYGYLPGLPREVLLILSPARIILVEADPEEIAVRRAKDADVRERDPESVAEMHLHQQMNRIAAMAYATMVDATVKIVQNRQGKLAEAAREIAETLK
jgi:adenylate kinase